MKPASRIHNGQPATGRPGETVMKKKVVVCGASGRMGQTIGRMVNESSDLELVGGINLRPSSFFGVEIVETRNAEDTPEEDKGGCVDRFHDRQRCCGKCEDGGPQ